MNGLYFICNFYLVITAITCMCLGILWIIVRGASPRCQIYNDTFQLVGVILAVNAFTFIYFYLVELGVNVGVPNIFRILCFVLGWTINVMWAKFIYHNVGSEYSYIMKVFLGSTIGLCVIFAAVSSFFMDPMWYIENTTPRYIMIGVYVIYTAMIIVLNVRIITFTALKDNYSSIRKYVCIMSVTLSVNVALHLCENSPNLGGNAMERTRVGKGTSGIANGCKLIGLKATESGEIIRLNQL